MQPQTPAEVSSWTPASSSRVTVPALASLAFALISYAIVIAANESALPDPDTYMPSETMPFNLTNALRHIEHLGQKRRTVSSVALEDALRYIMTEMTNLRLTALQNNYVMDIQTFRSTSGSFCASVGSLDSFHAYDDIPSVVIRIRPHYIEKNAKIPALLVNAHVDSALGSPGVSDNLSGVGLSMDIIRAIVSSSSEQFRLKRPVIFLFNGAEETILPGAHSFVSQHPWGRVSAAHINLESIGPGDTYYLFQLGPNAPWLAHAYANAVSIPYGTIAATDVFKTKVSYVCIFALYHHCIRLSFSYLTSVAATCLLNLARSSFQQTQILPSLTNLVAFLALTLRCMIMDSFTTRGMMTLTTSAIVACFTGGSLLSSLSWSWLLRPMQLVSTYLELVLRTI